MGVLVGPHTRTNWDPFLQRPIVDVLQPRHVNVKRPHLADLGDASIEWGKVSAFFINTRASDVFPYEWGGVGPTPEKPKNDDGTQDPPPPDQPDRRPDTTVYHWVEVGRETTVVRIENPDDSSQHVDVERIEQILFRAPDGTYHQFDLKNRADGDQGGGNPYDASGNFGGNF